MMTRQNKSTARIVACLAFGLFAAFSLAGCNSGIQPAGVGYESQDELRDDADDRDDNGRADITTSERIESDEYYSDREPDDDIGTEANRQTSTGDNGYGDDDDDDRDDIGDDSRSDDASDDRGDDYDDADDGRIDDRDDGDGDDVRDDD